jgi:hypothetical protein
MFPIQNGLKKGNVLSSLLSNFALDYAIRRVQVNQDGLTLYGTRQHLVYAHDVHILGGNLYNIQKKVEVLVVASKETGLEVNAEITKYVVLSRERNAGRIKI